MTAPINDTAAPTPTRRGFLESIFGKDKAQAVKSDLDTAQLALDGLGVARKEQVVLEIAAPSETPAETPAPAPTEEAGEQPPEAMAVASAITEIIMGAAAQDSTVLTSPDRMAEVIAGAIRPSEASEEAPPGEMPMDDEEKPEMKSLIKSNQDQANFIMQATKDMGEIADAFNAQQSEITRLKSLASKLPDIEKELADLRALVGGRPRIASQASETVLDPTSQQAKAMEKSIREGTEGESKFFSIPVKNTPK